MPNEEKREYNSYSDSDLKNVVKDLSSKVLQLSNECNNLKNEVRDAIKPKYVQPKPNHCPLSPDIVVIEHDHHSPVQEHQTSHNDDMDTSGSNTIDDNVPDDETTDSLNSQALTTQLHQLGHTLTSSRH